MADSSSSRRSRNAIRFSRIRWATVCDGGKLAYLFIEVNVELRTVFHLAVHLSRYRPPLVDAGLSFRYFAFLSCVSVPTFCEREKTFTRGVIVSSSTKVSKLWTISARDDRVSDNTVCKVTSLSNRQSHSPNLLLTPRHLSKS